MPTRGVKEVQAASNMSIPQYLSKNTFVKNCIGLGVTFSKLHGLYVSMSVQAEDMHDLSHYLRMASCCLRLAIFVPIWLDDVASERKMNSMSWATLILLVGRRGDHLINLTIVSCRATDTLYRTHTLRRGLNLGSR